MTEPVGDPGICGFKDPLGRCTEPQEVLEDGTVLDRCAGHRGMKSSTQEEATQPTGPSLADTATVRGTLILDASSAMENLFAHGLLVPASHIRGQEVDRKEVAHRAASVLVDELSAQVLQRMLLGMAQGTAAGDWG